MIEVILNKIRIDEKSEEQMIVLREKSGTRQLPIIIGTSEVAAIKRNLSGIQPPRPMTHDLLADIICSVGVKLDSIVIDRIESNTFYAKLILLAKSAVGRGKKIIVDARPSDSIALAVRLEAPIFVEEKIFEDLKKYQQTI